MKNKKETNPSNLKWLSASSPLPTSNFVLPPEAEDGELEKQLLSPN